MTHIADLIPSVLEIARRAGDAIMEIYTHEADFGVEQKPDDTPITLADRASNLVICEALTALTPDWPIISEENELPPHAQRLQWDYCWIIDPLDGTKEFIRRNGNFTVNIALVLRGEAILGAIYAPASGECFWAVQGLGAYEVMPGGKKERLHCKAFRWESAGLRILSSRSNFNTETKLLIKQFPAPQFVSRGSALKFGILARGQADLYPRLGPTGEWDTAAGQIILEEAGGAVVDYHTRQPLRYNKERTENPFFLAHGRLLMP